MNYEYDWEKIPTGSTFTAEIGGVKCEGRIYKDVIGRIYLCQNKKEGAIADNRLGYKYSWYILDGNVSSLHYTKVENLRVYLPEKGYKIPVELNHFGGNEVNIKADYVKVGCTTVTFEQVEAVYLKMKKLREAK